MLGSMSTSEDWIYFFELQYSLILCQLTQLYDIDVDENGNGNSDGEKTGGRREHWAGELPSLEPRVRAIYAPAAWS
jgi:hypothetical protein